MIRTRVLWIVFVLVALAAFLQVAYFHPQLPERVATKFGANGDPVAWSGKAGFLRANLIGLGFQVLLFPALWLVLPRFPASMVNMPNKPFWLAPERYAYTIGLIRDFLLFIGCLTLMLLAAITYMAIQANLATPPRMGSASWIILGAYFVLMLGASARLIFFFYRPNRWL